MIYYFSGTGNSRYAAILLSRLLDDTVINIASGHKIQTGTKKQGIIIVCPVYSWGIPPIVLDFVQDWTDHNCDELRDSKTRIWLVLTCGDETAMAPEMLENILAGKRLHMSGAWSVIMPNVYVLLPGFNVDSPEIEQRKLDDCTERIKYIASRISDNVEEIDVARGSLPKMKSRFIYRLFRRWGINTRRWNWTQECIGCGKCADACPVNNISMVSGHPRWGHDCTSCLACYHSCPVHAVAYGKITTGKGQYHCPLRN